MIPESEWETFRIDRLVENGWEHMPGPNVAPGKPEGRTEWDSLVLRSRAAQTLRTLDPGVPPRYLDEALGGDPRGRLGGSDCGGLPIPRSPHPWLSQHLLHRCRRNRAEPDDLHELRTSGREDLVVDAGVPRTVDIYGAPPFECADRSGISGVSRPICTMESPAGRADWRDRTDRQNRRVKQCGRSPGPTGGADSTSAEAVAASGAGS